MAVELLDSHVSSTQAKLAIDALLKHARKERKKAEETELLGAKDEHIWLVVATKQMHPQKKLKPASIPLEHPIIDPRTTQICLITKDPQREYKDLLDAQKIKFIGRVVGVSKLKGKFRGYEERRQLLHENGLFLADERVIPLMPQLLGKEWFKAKKQPIPVNLTRKDLKTHLERAVSSTYMHQNLGTCTSIKLATISHSHAQIYANLKKALPAIISHIKNGWDNIQSLHIKTSRSTSLPVWSCNLATDEGGRWEGMDADAQDNFFGIDEANESTSDSPNEQPERGKKRNVDAGGVVPPKKKIKTSTSHSDIKPTSSPSLPVAGSIPDEITRLHPAKTRKTVDAKAEAPIPEPTPTALPPKKKTKKGSSGASKAEVSLPSKEVLGGVPTKVQRSSVKAPSTAKPPTKTKTLKDVPFPEASVSITREELAQKKEHSGLEKKKKVLRKEKPGKTMGRGVKGSLLGVQ